MIAISKTIPVDGNNGKSQVVKRDDFDTIVDLCQLPLLRICFHLAFLKCPLLSSQVFLSGKC